MILPRGIQKQIGTADLVDRHNRLKNVDAIRQYYVGKQTDQLNETVAIVFLSHGLSMDDLCSLCDFFAWSAYRFIVDLGDEDALLNHIHKPNRALLKILKNPVSILRYHQVTGDHDVAESVRRLAEHPELTEGLLSLSSSQKLTNGF